MFSPDTKFLVVDDFGTMRKIIKKTLNKLGYKNIVEAEDGIPALATLKECAASGEPVQFVVSDWNMPGMTGIDLLKNCKGDPALKNIPFMLVTAENDQGNVLEAVSAGVSDYVVKPFSAETLKGKIEKIYNKTNSKAA